MGLAPRPLAGPLGLLALGSLLSELVTSLYGGGRAHGLDGTNWSDLALYRGLRNSGLGHRIRHGVPERRERRHQRQHSQA